MRRITAALLRECYEHIGKCRTSGTRAFRAPIVLTISWMTLLVIEVNWSIVIGDLHLFLITGLFALFVCIYSSILNVDNMH